MPRSATQLRADALAIWQAGVEAVRSDRLVREHVIVEGGELHIAEVTMLLDDIDRIVVVGGGKAGAGMAAGLEQALGSKLLKEKRVSGWLNVPADCVRELGAIHLHPARPAGVNEPTPAGVAGAETILEMVSSLTPRDLCLCLISGGGSALLPAPAVGISLAEKLAVTRFLSSAGANIQELNTVRKHLSRIKGGRLAAALSHGTIISLIISDVLGDPLDLIASGPTVPDHSTPAEALAILLKHGAQQEPSLENVVAFLQTRLSSQADKPFPADRVTNIILGNNALAVDAAGIEAERRGYSHAMHSSNQMEGAAEEVGRHQARLARSMREEAGPDCLITGGEPVVKLAPAEIRGKGGRNQQLVLAALDELGTEGLTGIAILSGGTDGEDGPTEAAGAFVDEAIAKSAAAMNLDIADALRRNDAYSFFAATDGLIRTGPTHTNVCDLRVVVVDRIADPHSAPHSV